MQAIPTPDPGHDGPTVADLVAIEREWPLIEAEMRLLEAEISALNAEGGPSPLDRRRIRRAEQRVNQVAAVLGVALVEAPSALKAVA